jgi:HAD superfamily hydrolase (TIGR01509 family)
VRAFIFDLDGTLVDTVYAHVMALQQALGKAGLEVPGWLIHRRIGMSGGLSARALAREIGRSLTLAEQEELQRRHGEIYAALQPVRRPLPGACELLRWLHSNGVPFGIATSGRHPDIDKSLAVLDLPAETVVLDRSGVLRAKPEPDLFIACAERMGVRGEDVYVVGDAVWDLLAARRAGMLSVGLLSGGYGENELIQAGAYRVYRDPQELLQYLDELGVPIPG